MTHDYFGEEVAARYDDSAGTEFEPAVIAATVDFLEPLADGGALELAIGTGRIALPLAARGVEVHGIDVSEAMVAQLRRKPGGAALPVVLGDMTTTRLERRFSLVYLVFNTIMNVTTQAGQVACFQTAATHLAPGGAFVVEVGIPDLQRLPPGEAFRPFHVSRGHLGFDEYDVAQQGLISHHYAIDRNELLSIPFRYVWPAELDLMARLAGLERAERWGDWDRSPYTGESRKHVSVWRKPHPS